jgi:drug/metabolite transporter (DMT)-like permease
MKSSSGLHVKTYVLICLMVVFGPLGDVFLSKGMKQIGAVSHWSAASLVHLFLQTFTSGLIWLGILFLLLFFVAYMLVLSWADYSFVQPASATSYAFVALLGYALLGEAVTSERWAGVLLICLGVFLVGRTPPRTTARSTADAISA